MVIIVIITDLKIIIIIIIIIINDNSNIAIMTKVTNLETNLKTGNVCGSYLQSYC